MTEKTELNYVADYEDACSCGTTPVVTATDEKGNLTEWGLCGPCLFGEASMLDPEEWNL
jgi:hypothetical protein